MKAAMKRKPKGPKRDVNIDFICGPRILTSGLRSVAGNDSGKKNQMMIIASKDNPAAK